MESSSATREAGRLPRGMGHGLAEPERDERWYRYSVRCDRAFAKKLEAAANRAGLSVTSFVQQHFETILAPPPPGADPTSVPISVPISAPGARFDFASFDVKAFAARHDVTPHAARVWGVMREAMSADGIAQVTQNRIAIRTGIPASRIPVVIRQLEEFDLLDKVAANGNGRAARYRVRNS